MHLFETLQNVDVRKMEGTINDSLPSWIQKQAVVQLSVRGHYDQSVNEARVEGSLNTQISIS